jgi:uncharacterized phage infection (PIP) family protein YhgE
MTLKEDLAELNEALPLLPDEVDALRETAEELAENASALEHEVAQAQDDLEKGTAHLRDALPSFRAEAAGFEQRVRGAADEAEAQWHAGSAELDAGDAQLARALEALDLARTDLTRMLTDAALRVDAAGSEGDAVILQVESAAQSATDRLQAAEHAFEEQVAALGAVLEKVHGTLAEAAADFQESAQQFASNGEFDTGVLVDYLDHRLTKYADHVAEVAADVATESENILVPFGTWLYEDVRTPLLASAEKLRIELEAVQAAAESQQQAVAKARGDHGQSLGNLQEVAQPLPASIEKIHEAAERVRQR